MDDAVDTSSTTDIELHASALWRTTDGAEFVYGVLDGLTARHRLSDAHLVVNVDGIGLQVFRRGGLAVGVDVVADLLARPAGLYGEPRVVPAGTSHVLGAMCHAALRAQVARRASALDASSGLSSRRVIDASLARAAACAARYGWTSTVVLLTTAGEGSASERWRALGDALRRSLRAGDEVGVARDGVALALLGNAGPDVVRPFVARVRAELTAAGADAVDLVAATACTPDETVDPSELRRLAWERLADTEGGMPTLPVARPSDVEFELRAIPGVVHVAVSGRAVTVVTTDPSDAGRHRVAQRAREEIADATVTVLHADVAAVDARGTVGAASIGDAPVPGAGAGTSMDRSPGTPPVDHGGPEQNGHVVTMAASAGATYSATGPHPGHEGQTGNRVALVAAVFHADRGVSEVSLALGGVRGTGRTPAGPLAGGAQATLTALGALGIELPFYLVSAERARGVAGDPVVVVLAPRSATGSGTLAERIGVAAGGDDVDAASRATLGALNRFLTGLGAPLTPPASAAHPTSTAPMGKAPAGTVPGGGAQAG